MYRVLWVVFTGGTDFSVMVVQICKPLTKKGRKYDPEYYLGAHNFPKNTPFGGGVFEFLCVDVLFPLWKYYFGRIFKLTQLVPFLQC